MGNSALLALAIFGLLVLRKRPTDVDGLAAKYAAKHDVPLWLVRSTGYVESGNKHLNPTGSGASKTWYPYGLQRARALDQARRMFPGFDEGDIESILNDLEKHTDLAVAEMARGWRRYGPDDERFRVWWVMPKAAHDGRPWDARPSGSVPWKKRLSNWTRAKMKFQARA